MTRSNALFAIAAGCLAAAFPAAGDPDQAAPSADEESSEGFERFIEEGLRTGLLTPAREADTPEFAGRLPSSHDEEEPAPLIRCSDNNPFDFSAFQEFSSYKDLPRAIAVAKAAKGGGHSKSSSGHGGGHGGGHGEEEGEGSSEGNFLEPTYVDAGHFGASFVGGGFDEIGTAKSLIALGMNSEALKVLQSQQGDTAEVLTALARLLDRRGRPDPDFFKAFAPCHPEGRFWHTVALIETGHEASDALAETLGPYRALPKEMRTQVAFALVPELEKQGEGILARKLLSEFSNEESEDNLHLSFADALLAVSEGRPDAEKALRAFVQNPRFREIALEALYRRDPEVETTVRDVLVDDIERRLKSPTLQDLSEDDIDIALNVLSMKSDYDSLVELSESRHLQDEAHQVKLRGRFTDMLRSDLSSGTPIRALAAIEALSVHSEMLEGVENREEIVDRLMAAAIEFGLSSGVRAFWEQAGDAARDETAIAWSRLAFHMNDHETVYMLATLRPDSHALNLYAARSAILDNDPLYADLFLEQLEPDPETLVILMEEDAVSGHWMLSDKIYEAATKLEDETYKTRVDRVLNLRRAAREETAAPPPVELSTVNDSLARIGARMAPDDEGGAHEQ